MAQLNPNIILSGRQPDVVNILGQAAQSAGATNAVRRSNALNDLYQEQGAGILAGDQNALNALSGMDPQTALGVQSTQLGMEQTRQSMRIAEQRLQIARRDANARFQANARALSAAEAAATAEKIEQTVAQGLAIPDAQSWDQLMASDETTREYVGQFEQREILAASFLGIKDALEMARGPENTEADREIQRVMSTGMSREDAIKVKEGIYKTITDPVTQETVLFDMQTRQVVRPAGAEGQNGQPPSPNGTPDLSFGAQFENANEAFGVGGAARGLANKVADTTLGMTPFPKTRQAQGDFKVFGESLINAFASAYGRQPPSWLLKNIETLIPNPGVLEGPGEAQDKLKSMARDLESRRVGLQRSANRRTSPGTRETLEGQIAGIDATLDQIYNAMAGFQSEQSNTTTSGVQWKVVD